MDNQNFAQLKTVDSIMELMADTNISEFSSSFNSSAQERFAENSLDPEAAEFPGVKPEDGAGLKSWREGCEIKASDENKTVFISQNLNKEYEAAEAKRKCVLYVPSVSKVSREIDYFNIILNKVGGDLKLTEPNTDRNLIFEKRTLLTEKLSKLKATIDKFIEEKLTGEPLTEAEAKALFAAQKKELAEYAFLTTDKKPQSNEKCMNMCSDCNIQIVAEEGQDFDSAMVAHSQTELHRSSMPEPPPPRKSKLEAAQTLLTEPDKKSVELVKKSPILKLNRIVNCLIDDHVMCEVCSVNFPSIMQEVYKHLEEPNHKEKLNVYNMQAQKGIIEKNPEIFGEDGQFQLNSQHTNLHKIFIDPTIKQAYCGLCYRQLPFSQSNIDEHIISGKHEKSLLDKVENSFDELVQLGIDVSVLNGIKSKSQQTKDPAAQGFINVADIQNMRRLLPDKPIKMMPEILDSNNMPIHNFEFYEQPELKKFLIENGLQRQAGGKFRCIHCPNLELPNSRFAVRHVSKHKTASTTSPAFENWKRPSNRNMPYSNEPKMGRVVMHKNGINYWCTSCRLPLVDASTAFAHVKTDNHVMYVDGVSFSSGTIFDCSTCKTTINGEKNACQHLVAAKHRENSKLDNLAKQEGRMNMIEERKQKQYEKQKQASEAQRKEKAAAETYGEAQDDKMFEKNGIVYSSDNGTYFCEACRWTCRKRHDIISHIYSYDHTISHRRRQEVS